jgi:hypothetical protein
MYTVESIALYVKYVHRWSFVRPYGSPRLDNPHFIAQWKTVNRNAPAVLNAPAVTASLFVSQSKNSTAMSSSTALRTDVVRQITGVLLLEP